MKLSLIRQLADPNSDMGLSSLADQGTDWVRSCGFDPGDIYQEVEMDSAFADTHRDISRAGSTVQLHSHTFYELLFCRTSAGVEYLVGAERYKLQKGDLVFVAPGISHRPILPEDMAEPYERDVLWISEEFVRDSVEKFPHSWTEKPKPLTLLRTAGTRWEYIGDLFRAGVTEYEARREGWEAAVAANTLTILVHIQRARMDDGHRLLRAEKPELLDQAMAYVEAHLSEKLTLGDIARRLYVSESTVSQTFRRKMGVSFYRCVTQRRLISAKALIEQGLAMEDVAERVGFSDYSVFFRAFKQEYGISPRQYRTIHVPE